jgi:hypothetical protein
MNVQDVCPVPLFVYLAYVHPGLVLLTDQREMLARALHCGGEEVGFLLVMQFCLSHFKDVSSLILTPLLLVRKKSYWDARS